jgi:hypothetical protein
MQIKFKTAYPINIFPIVAQEELLNQWSKSCRECQVKFIDKAKIDFTTYDMLEYPDQKQLKKEYATYLSTFNPDCSDENVERCFKEFAKKYRILELTITPEDYD